MWRFRANDLFLSSTFRSATSSAVVESSGLAVCIDCALGCNTQQAKVHVFTSKLRYVNHWTSHEFKKCSIYCSESESDSCLCQKSQEIPTQNSKKLPSVFNIYFLISLRLCGYSHCPDHEQAYTPLLFQTVVFKSENT